MRGILIEEYGGSEVMQKRDDLVMPVASPGEVLVEVAYAGINYMDILTRRGAYEHSDTYDIRLPCILGMEGAGRIVETGADVQNLATGDHVAWCVAWGSYAEYVSIPASLVARISDDIDDKMAAASMFSGCTAHYLIEDVARLSSGDRCLIHAAAGGIGQLLVQMAKKNGAEVFATASTPDKRSIVKALGADHVLDYDQGGFADSIRDLTGGAGVDIAFDAVGAKTFRDTLRAVRRFGLVVNFGAVSGAIEEFDPIELGESGSLYLTRPRLADYLSGPGTVQRRADAIFAAMCKGTLTIDLEAVYSLDNVEKALARIERRQHRGKSVLAL